MNIERFRFDGVDLVQNDTGRWVRYECYAARVAELEAALSQYADKNNWGYYDDSGCDKGHGLYTDACFIGPELARAALGGRDE